ncbi:MAG: carbamoyltransferase HypF [Armatimonadetes bacterium]|nr:carbamoyltransferase HypF [Armatimonadota bacterium]
MVRKRFLVEGTVQGVGFRPFVRRLATRHRLSGWVVNRAGEVEIEVEGHPSAVALFEKHLRNDAPPLALISRLDIQDRDTVGESVFNILPSVRGELRGLPVPPDMATCEACVKELFDPKDRRYRYPFINCTDCGPRFTIVREFPYDRDKTSMASFQMCAECRNEYENPDNRRYHAQPNACPVCGPQAALRHEGAVIAVRDDAMKLAAAALSDGSIVAIKGLGGYHLACDAGNEEAVARLRVRKAREEKPFAVMARDLSVISAICSVSAMERAALLGSGRPIVLLQRAKDRLALSVAPTNRFLGVMLPYTPLHHLLLADFEGRALVMTSGNIGEHPIAYEDEHAIQSLRKIADLVLTHDRPIETRCDDSIVRVTGGRTSIIRRSRGFVPHSIPLPFELAEPILGCGAHLKNVFCLCEGNEAFLSHHIGDLETLESRRSYVEGIDHFKQLLRVEPACLAHDMHPDYPSTQYALEQAGVETIAVQHHHAHIASVVAEHDLKGPVLGVAFDGTGYGTDGTIWGGEFLLADLCGFKRVAHLELLVLPGGEQAIREPWRIAAWCLSEVYGDSFQNMDLPLIRGMDSSRWRTLKAMARRGFQTPRTSSVGRLFDAVSSIVTGRTTVRYEGQAAIELEMLADPCESGHYRFDLRDESKLSWGPMIRRVVEDLLGGVPAAAVAARFHSGLSVAIMEVCERIRRDGGPSQVALSGGVFQNALLLKRATELLRDRGYCVWFNERVPANDGGIAYGQVAVAGATMRSKVCA